VVAPTPAKTTSGRSATNSTAAWEASQELLLFTLQTRNINSELICRQVLAISIPRSETAVIRYQEVEYEREGSLGRRGCCLLSDSDCVFQSTYPPASPTGNFEMCPCFTVYGFEPV